MIISRRALWPAVPLLLGAVAAACSAGTEPSTAPQISGPTTDGAGAAVDETTPAAEVLEIDSRWTKYSSLGESPAPELVAITAWANAEPFTLASRRGDVIMIDFWTLACINCIRTLPHLREWHEKYADDGLIIVGVHYPEFDFERDMDAVVEAAKKYGLDYAIAQDNTGATWRAYRNRYWPTLYLIDRQGNIRYTHIGEGRYEETDRKIRQLLTEPG